MDVSLSHEGEEQMNKPSNNHTSTQAKPQNRKNNIGPNPPLLPLLPLLWIFPSSPPKINLWVGGGKASNCRHLKSIPHLLYSYKSRRVKSLFSHYPKLPPLTSPEGWFQWLIRHIRSLSCYLVLQAPSHTHSHTSNEEKETIWVWQLGLWLTLQVICHIVW